VAAHLARHHQKAQGQQFDIGKTPDGFLQPHHFFELLQLE
jgi:hypothetical protein